MATKKDITIDEILNEASEELKETAVVKAESKPTSVDSAAAIDYAKKEAQRKSLVNTYRGEDKIAVTVSPFYAPYLGKVIRQSVNGIFVDIPADGQTYMVNKSHAAEIINKVRKIDAMIARQKRAGEVSKNFEYSPGELHL